VRSPAQTRHFEINSVRTALAQHSYSKRGHSAEAASNARAAATSSHSIQNSATLVTPTVRFPVPNYLTTNDER
ncbi:hypothetical protein, partial [Mesorhizobium tianshanense]|uniref:hypothetical protein n=1 Tax=Mesorhizobium tianshanense TaxID=39844 RepID=UPI0024E071B2